MADNIAVTPGSGATIAADDVSGVLYQRVKVDLGGDGATSPLVRGQQARASSLPVTLSTEDIAAIATEATLAAIETLLGAGLPSALSSDRLKVDGSGVTQPISGTVTATATDLDIRDLAYTTDDVTAYLAAGEQHAGSVGGHTNNAGGAMTRPADTTAYAAGDGVTTSTSAPAAMTVTGVARIDGGSGVVIGGRATKSTATTTNASFRLWLYQDTPSAIPNDNSAFSAAVVADRAKLIGTATADFSGTSAIVGSDGIMVPLTLSRTQMAFVCAGGSDDLIIIWEARAAYTPGSSEVFYVELDVLQD